MSEYAAQIVDDESPEVMRRNLVTGGHLLASATAFFFLAFLFAYVYLRALNSDHLWHPKGVTPPVGMGTAIVALLVLSAVAVRLALVDERAGRASAMRQKLGAGLLLGVAALVVQVIEWLTVGFGPADGGYASVFVGWTSFYFLFVLLTLYWVETQFATAVRNPDSGDVGLGAMSFFWSFLVAIGILTWVVLYLVSP